MKLSELLSEAPDFINRELPVTDNEIHISFYSEDTVKREFDVLAKNSFDNKEVWTIIKKDKSFAVIGEIGLRPRDKKPGLVLIGHLDFKSDIEWEYWPKTEYEQKQNVLQVDGVQVMNAFKFKGLASLFYESIVDAGFILVSDTTQYIGGRRLWEKLATNSKHLVHLVDKGQVVMDGVKPLVYNGHNYPAEKIWTEPGRGIDKSTKYFLLILKQKAKN